MGELIANGTQESDIDTNSLLEALRKAGEEMSAADFREQAISYVMGCVGGDDPEARERVKHFLEKKYGSISEP